jgi:hypothetical protein
MPLGYSTFYIFIISVALLALNDFHRPHDPKDFRNSVSIPRYIVGAGLYISSAIIMYSMFVSLLTSLFSGDWITSKVGPKCQGEECGMIVSSVSATCLVILILVPGLPLIRHYVSKLRDATQAFALFPSGINRLLYQLENAKFREHERASEVTAKELSRYGVQQMSWKSVHMGRPLLMAKEIQSIILSIEDLKDDKEFGGAIRRLLKVYKVELGEMELKRSRFFRCMAQGFVVMTELEHRSNFEVESQWGVMRSIDDLAPPSAVEANSAVAGFVEDVGAPLLAGYRRMLAQAAISGIVSASSKSEFIRRFGYDVQSINTIPLWPVVASFAAVWTGIAFPSLILGRVSSRAFDPSEFWGMVSLLVVATNQAIILTLSILWAIIPKIDMNYARPSLKTLPTRSYVWFGLWSYCTGLFLIKLQFMVFPFLPLAAKQPGSIFILSLPPAVFTVIVAILVDWHLMGRSINSPKDRIFDGLVLFFAIGITQLVQVSLLYHFLLFPLPIFWTFTLLPQWLSKALLFIGLSEYTLVFALIGFAVGIAVPASAAASIDRRSPLYGDGYGETDLAPKRFQRAVVRLPARSKA